jgi:type I restriction enzyme S subunit
MSETLPQGWIETIFDAVCYVNGGFAFKSKEYTDSGLPLIRISNIVDEKIALDKKPIFIDKKRLDEFSTFIVEKNDILIALSGATTGKFGKYDLSDIALLNQRVGQFKFINKATEHRDFYFYYLRLIKDKILEESYGNAQPNISPKQLGLFSIPLPPLAEQQRIVAKLEALLTRSTNARNELAAIPKLIERYKQAVLAAAFRGDLTADWRKENANKDKMVLKASIKDPFSLDFYAPQSWQMCILGEACKITGGSQPPKAKFSDKPQNGYVRLIQIRDYKTDKFITYVPKELVRRFCSSEDIMIGRYGPPIFQILKGLNGAYNVALMKAESQLKSLSNNYLYYFLQCPNLYNYVEVSSDRTAGQSGVNKAHLEKYPIIIPSLEEQSEIVERIKTAFKAIDTIQIELTQAEALRKRLEQATLAKAFRGELVPQDPNDEPASVLLERIRAEREAQPKAKRTQRVKSMKKTISILDEEKTMLDRANLLDVIKDAGKPVTPEQLLEGSAYTEDTIEDFYAALKLAVENKQIVEDRKGEKIVLRSTL